MRKLEIGIPLYPGLCWRGLLPALTVFESQPQARLWFISANGTPVVSGNGGRLLADTSYEDSPNLDVLCVPGGTGQTEICGNDPLLDFLLEQGWQARVIAAICDGAILLAAAGLLEGYRATCGAGLIHRLPSYGSQPVITPMSVDRGRITTALPESGLHLACVTLRELERKCGLSALAA